MSTTTRTGGADLNQDTELNHASTCVYLLQNLRDLARASTFTLRHTRRGHTVATNDFQSR
jgi:hypothetical protein